jgi:hypothetical protein
MAKLYVANCTMQMQRVYYRIDFDVDKEGKQTIVRRFQPAKQVDIPSGRQTVVGGDLHADQIDDIINQLRTFGLMAVTEINNIRSFTPFIFNLNFPVKEDAIRHVAAKNQGLKIEEGKQRRAKAAVVMNDIVANTVANKFADEGIPKEPTQDFEIEFEQLEQSEAGEKRIEEGYRMDPKAPPPPGAKATKPPAKKRSRSQAGA